jgi:Uma2 family endonuclease
MSSQTSPAEVLDALEHLPAGATLVIHEFSWDDYEQLLEDLGEGSHLRVSYDCGRLAVLSPSPTHGQSAWFIELLVAAFCEIRGLHLRGFGQTTWKKKSVRKGLEADACYYVATRIPGNKNLSLETDPPPDICVEVDVTRNSVNKLSVYASLGIPEVWIYDESSFRFYALSDGKYSTIEESRFLLGLTGPVLAEAMEACRTSEPLDVLKAFRNRIQQLKP